MQLEPTVDQKKHQKYSAKQRIKSFRVARRCESSVGLTWIGARRRGMEFSGGLRGGEMAGRAGMRGKVVYGLGCGAARGGSKKWARDASVARRVAEARASGAEVGQGRECGSESLRVKLAQREAVACGARAVDGYGSGVGGGSRPHRVSRREPANEEKVADMAMRADGRFCGSGVGGVVIG